jgi:hypothetical protein
VGVGGDPSVLVVDVQVPAVFVDEAVVVPAQQRGVGDVVGAAGGAEPG